MMISKNKVQGCLPYLFMILFLAVLISIEYFAISKMLEWEQESFDRMVEDYRARIQCPVGDVSTVCINLADFTTHDESYAVKSNAVQNKLEKELTNDSL